MLLFIQNLPRARCTFFRDTNKSLGRFSSREAFLTCNSLHHVMYHYHDSEDFFFIIMYENVCMYIIVDGDGGGGDEKF